MPECFELLVSSASPQEEVGCCERRLGDVLAFLASLWVLALTWWVAGCFEVTQESEQVTFCHCSDTFDYTQENENRILEMRTTCSDASLLAYVMKVEEDFRVKAVELCPAPEHPLPWSPALQRAHGRDKERGYMWQSSSSSGAPSAKAVRTTLLKRGKGGDEDQAKRTRDGAGKGRVGQ